MPPAEALHRSPAATGSHPSPGFATVCVLGAIGLTLLAGACQRVAADDNVARLEPGEEKPGGDATSRSRAINANAFSLSSGNMPLEKELDFKIGNGVFRRQWVSAPASVTSSDGLGPLFNARSCQGCHLKDGRGHTPREGEDAVSMFLRLSVPVEEASRDFKPASHVNVRPEPNYGSQLQNFSIQGQPAEGRMGIAWREEEVTLAGGEAISLRVPSYSIENLAYGPLHPELMLSPRVAPQMIGLGLLEAVPEADIVARADPDDANRDGISGRENRVPDRATGDLELGRFGWKAGAPSIRQQSAEAFAADMGLSTHLIPAGYGECTEAQSVCRAAPDGASEKSDGVEIDDKLFDLVVFYAQNLAVPPRRNPSDPEILAGKALFHATGCASCHTPSFKTGDIEDQPHLSRQTIWPHTDLLLHDMGDGLADHRPEGRAGGREWRTPPLWGVGLTEAVSFHTEMLHDGRARNVLEATLWHGGEAEKSRDAFAALQKADRDRLIAFVKSL